MRNQKHHREQRRHFKIYILKAYTGVRPRGPNTVVSSVSFPSQAGALGYSWWCVLWRLCSPTVALLLADTHTHACAHTHTHTHTFSLSLTCAHDVLIFSHLPFFFLSQTQSVHLVLSLSPTLLFSFIFIFPHCLSSPTLSPSLTIVFLQLCSL